MIDTYTRDISNSVVSQSCNFQDRSGTPCLLSTICASQKESFLIICTKFKTEEMEKVSKYF